MTPAVGDFAVVRTNGIPARIIRWVTRSPVNHAILAVGPDTIIEAQPRGAVLASITKYPDAIWAGWPLADYQRELVAAWGRAHVGVGYSWIDDAEIGFVDRLHWAPRWMRARLRSTRTLMCSQLVDAAYQAAGVHLFHDDRPAGGVSPGDLYDLIQHRKAAR